MTMSIRIEEDSKRDIETRRAATLPALSCDFSVGDWQVSPQLNRIKHCHSNEERQLEPRLIKLLCFLASNEQQVLSREELVQELWPRVVVNENSLTRAVSELRKQLQCKNPSAPIYIETIPKRGYRLLPRIESVVRQAASPQSDRSTLRSDQFTLPILKHSSVAIAACLCLLVGGWLSLDGSGFLNRLDSADAPMMLSDEVLDTRSDYLGGELQLSTLDKNSVAVESIATPVVSLDEKQFAFIQYDTTGSTIFLGGLDTAIEPIPVYFSNQHLFNLAWSPVGNNLLFAQKSSMATAAVYASGVEAAELVTLNLNTLQTNRLVKDLNPADKNTPKGLNLT